MAGTSLMDEKERKAKISALLHSTEASIKKGDLDEGLLKVREIYAIDSRNPYAHAFEERINGMKKKRDEKAAEAKAAAPASASSPAAVPAAAPAAQKGPVLVSFNPKHGAEPRKPQPDPVEELQRAFELERVKWKEEKAFIIGRESMKTKERLLEAYRAFVMLMDVSIAKEQLDTLLLSLRGILDVSEQEHTEVIRSVQVNTYIDSLTSIWHKGAVTAMDNEELKQLRALYGISDAEHAQLERQVKRKLGIPESRDSSLAAC